MARTTLCEFDLEGMHIELQHVVWDGYPDLPESYVATLWVVNNNKPVFVSTINQLGKNIGSIEALPPRLGQKSFGNQAAAERWILKQLEHASFVLLAAKAID